MSHPQETFPPTLVARLSDTQLCLARYELRREPFFAFSATRLQPERALAANLREAQENEALLSAPTRNTELLVVTPVVAVPLADFQEEDCTQFYDFAIRHDKPHRVFYDTLPSANVVLLFGMDADTCRVLDDTLPNLRYTAALTPVLRHFARKGATNAGVKRLFFHLHGQAMDTAVFEGSRLELLNTFETRTVADCAYYALNVAQKLGADLQRDQLYVAGAASLRDAAVGEFRKYAANVSGINPAGEYNRSIVATTPDVPYDMVTFLLD